MGKWFQWGGPAAGLFGSGRPPSAGAPPLGSLEFLAREWLAWESSPRRREQLLGELYYRGEQKILSRNCLMNVPLYTRKKEYYKLVARTV